MLNHFISKIRDGARAVLSEIVGIARSAVPVCAVCSAFPRRIARMSQCAIVALALAVSAIPATQVVAHDNDARSCLEVEDGGQITIASNRRELWNFTNTCAYTVLAGWCFYDTADSTGCRFDNTARLAPGANPPTPTVNGLAIPGKVAGTVGADGIRYGACSADGGTGVSSEGFPSSASNTVFSCPHAHGGGVSEVNECATNNGGCPSNSTCNDPDRTVSGNAQCTCNAGFVSSGNACVADTGGGGGGGPVSPSPSPSPSPSSGGGGGDGGSNNTWLYVGGGVAAVILLAAVSGGFSDESNITPIVEYSSDGQIYGARLEVSAPQKSGAMWWEYRGFHGGHSQDHSVKFGGDWADSGLFASGAIEEGDAGIDWRASGGKKWESGQWALHSGVDAAGLGQFGRIPTMSLQMSVKYAADGWWTTSGFNVPADKPSDAKVEVRTEWNF